MFSTNDEIEEKCPTTCTSSSFLVNKYTVSKLKINSMGFNGNQIQYRDTNKRAGKLIRQRVNLTADYQIYFCEIDLKTNEIELNQEKISYSIGKKIV